MTHKSNITRKAKNSDRKRAGDRLASLDEIEVDIEKLVAGGDGLARFEGIPLFVPRAAPGDRLRVRLVERKPDYGRAEIVEILKPAAERRVPPCDYFGTCGGCDLQHLEDDYQVELKVAAVLETLRRLGGVVDVPPLEIVKGPQWSYRCRTQLHIEKESELASVGYRARRSHEVVPVESCPILVPELESILPTLGAAVGDSPHARVDLLSGDSGALSTAPVTAGLPHGAVKVTAGEFTYELDARCFFQAHRQLLPTLIEKVVDKWTGESAVDLYAGVGLFSLPMARNYDTVVAVEGDRVAARFARQNAKRYRIGQMKVVSNAVESWIERLPSGVSRVVVDPPRAGLSYRVRKTLLARAPQRLTYVSCHAAALARDLKVFLQSYSIESLTVLDMFPQTGQIEVVAQLALSRS